MFSLLLLFYFIFIFIFISIFIFIYVSIFICIFIFIFTQLILSLSPSLSLPLSFFLSFSPGYNPLRINLITKFRLNLASSSRKTNWGTKIANFVYERQPCGSIDSCLGTLCSAQLLLCALWPAPPLPLPLCPQVAPKLVSSKFRRWKVLHFCVRLLSSFSLTRAVCVMLIINRNFRRHFVNCKKLQCTTPPSPLLPSWAPFQCYAHGSRLSSTRTFWHFQQAMKRERERGRVAESGN